MPDCLQLTFAFSSTRFFPLRFVAKQLYSKSVGYKGTNKKCSWRGLGFGLCIIRAGLGRVKEKDKAMTSRDRSEAPHTSPAMHSLHEIPEITPSFYSITSPRDPHVHLPVTYFLFHVTTFHSVLVLFVPQLPKYGTPYRLTFCSLKPSLHLGIV